MSGEPACSREVRLLTVGGGGGTLPNRAGGGSGVVVFNTVNITANRELEIIVGLGGARNQSGEASTVSYLGGNLLQVGEGGARAELTDGGDGYSGGGAQGVRGGTDGGNGDDFGSQYYGGSGTGLDVAEVSFDVFSVSSGTAGEGDLTYGGGGGGGVEVAGPSLEGGDSSLPGEGGGWGGGAGGATQTNVGRPGLIIMEIVRDLLTPN